MTNASNYMKNMRETVKEIAESPLLKTSAWIALRTLLSHICCLQATSFALWKEATFVVKSFDIVCVVEQNDFVHSFTFFNRHPQKILSKLLPVRMHTEYRASLRRAQVSRFTVQKPTKDAKSFGCSLAVLFVAIDLTVLPRLSPCIRACAAMSPVHLVCFADAFIS